MAGAHSKGPVPQIYLDLAAAVRTTIIDVLDSDLPADPYPPDLFHTKVQAVFDHVVSAYGDDGSSIYEQEIAATGGTGSTSRVAHHSGPRDNRQSVVERIRKDAELASKVA